MNRRSATSVSSGVSGRTTLLVAMMFLAVGVVGCDRDADEESDSKNIPETINFTVDGESVYYRWRQPGGEMSTAQSLSQIPLAARPAVAVFVSGKTPSLKRADGYYVANLLESEPGDASTARLREPIWLNRAGAATDRAARLALSVKEAATPEIQKENESPMENHELRERQIDIGDIQGSEREVDLFKEQTGSGSSPKQMNEQLKKYIGSDEIAPERGAGGAPLKPDEPATERAQEYEGQKPWGERHPEVDDDDEGSSTGDDHPSTEEMRRQLQEARESGVAPGSLGQ